MKTVSRSVRYLFYADRLCISTKYLTGICRSITNGASAKQIIDQHVILEIKVLLQSTELSMQEIADRLGFPDQSYLGRYFKRYEGMSLEITGKQQVHNDKPAC